MVEDPRVAQRRKVIAELLEKEPTLTATQLSNMTGIPRTSVRRYLDILRAGGLALVEQTPESDIKIKAETSRYAILSQKYRDALNIIEELNSTLATLINVGNDPENLPIVAKFSEKKREVVPVVVASDWHIEEQVKLEITNGMNEYNLAIAESSVSQFFSNAAELIRQTKQNSTVNTVVVAVLGDIINGVIRDEDLQTNQQTSVEALTTARSLLYSGLKQLAEQTGCHLRVICCVGNHGRLTSKIYPSNQVRNSLEYLLYKTIERDFRDHEKIDVVVSEAGYYIQDIYGVRVRFHHGHTFRFHGGIGGLSVPILRKISQLNQIERADLDVCGHFHSMQVFNNCILNGSLVGANGYSIQLGIPFEPPRQTFFLIDSKYGRSVVTPIFIDREMSKAAVDGIKAGK